MGVNMKGLNKVQVSSSSMANSKLKTKQRDESIAYRTRSAKRRRSDDSSSKNSRIGCTMHAKKMQKPDTEDPSVGADFTCGICFDDSRDRGVINCCDHKFCYDCIKTWMERSSSCPHCKRPVIAITRTNKTRRTVEPVEKKVLKDTIEREERSNFERYILVPTTTATAPTTTATGSVYDDSTIFNVLLGLRNHSNRLMSQHQQHQQQQHHQHNHHTAYLTPQHYNRMVYAIANNVTTTTNSGNSSYNRSTYVGNVWSRNLSPRNRFALPPTEFRHNHNHPSNWEIPRQRQRPRQRYEHCHHINTNTNTNTNIYNTNTVPQNSFEGRHPSQNQSQANIQYPSFIPEISTSQPQPQPQQTHQSDPLVTVPTSSFVFPYSYTSRSVENQPRAMCVPYNQPTARIQEVSVGTNTIYDNSFQPRLLYGSTMF